MWKWYAYKIQRAILEHNLIPTSGYFTVCESRTNQNIGAVWKVDIYATRGTMGSTDAVSGYLRWAEGVAFDRLSAIRRAIYYFLDFIEDC